jgi:surfeit locus 1 family protein
MRLFSLVCLLLLAGLIWLGVWQLHRLTWKRDLIAQVNRTLTSPPLALDAALKLGKAAEYHKVALTGRFDHAKEGFVYGIANGAPVYHVLTPFTTVDGRVLLVDRGIIPQEKRDPKTRQAGNSEAVQNLVGVWRKPDPPEPMAPAADNGERIWLSRDITWIARVDHITFAAPAVIEADATPNPGGWPKGGQTVVSFRNEHLQYAITWFALGLVLILCYGAMHVSLGRLRWKRGIDPMEDAP